MKIRTNKNPIIKLLFTPLIWVTAFIGHRFPKLLIKMRYYARFHKCLDLKNPKTLNEKILHMSLCTNTTLWTRLADKYNVRGYIHECGLSEILIPLYGYWRFADEIDFNKLPNSFVLKTVQGSGDVILVKDKTKLDIEKTKQKLQKSINTKFGELEGGKHYMRIPPAAIAEAMLENDEVSKKHSSSIIDYKIWCFNGKPQYIMTCSNRDLEGLDLMIHDLEWKSYPQYIAKNSEYRTGKILPKPNNFESMLVIAEKLAKPFPVVRVDLYNLDGKIYFGEMTFTSLGGLMNYYSDEFQNLAGSLIDINYCNE